MVADLIEILTEEALAFQLGFEFTDSLICQVEGDDGEKRSGNHAREKIVIGTQVTLRQQTCGEDAHSAHSEDMEQAKVEREVFALR